MGTTETSGNHGETMGDAEFAAEITRILGAAFSTDAAELLRIFGRKLDHLDEQLHEIRRTLQPISDHPEAVARGLGMLDPGSGIRKYLPGGKR